MPTREWPAGGRVGRGALRRRPAGRMLWGWSAGAAGTPGEAGESQEVPATGRVSFLLALPSGGGGGVSPCTDGETESRSVKGAGFVSGRTGSNLDLGDFRVQGLPPALCRAKWNLMEMLKITVVSRFLTSSGTKHRLVGRTGPGVRARPGVLPRGTRSPSSLDFLAVCNTSGLGEVGVLWGSC